MSVLGRGVEHEYDGRGINEDDDLKLLKLQLLIYKENSDYEAPLYDEP